MKTEKIVDEFSLIELESRLEMKPWEITVCPGNQCGFPPQ
jgi:hypothetical protein